MRSSPSFRWKKNSAVFWETKRRNSHKFHPMRKNLDLVFIPFFSLPSEISGAESDPSHGRRRFSYRPPAVWQAARDERPQGDYHQQLQEHLHSYPSSREVWLVSPNPAVRRQNHGNRAAKFYQDEHPADKVRFYSGCNGNEPTN